MAMMLTWVAKAICRTAPNAASVVRRTVSNPECVAALRYVIAALVAAALYEDQGRAQIGRHAAW